MPGGAHSDLNIYLSSKPAAARQPAFVRGHRRVPARRSIVVRSAEKCTYFVDTASLGKGKKQLDLHLNTLDNHSCFTLILKLL